jgi:hypothetical protein
MTTYADRPDLIGIAFVSFIVGALGSHLFLK